MTLQQQQQQQTNIATTSSTGQSCLTNVHIVGRRRRFGITTFDFISFSDRLCSLLQWVSHF
jgi:hypothetical protein